MTDRKILNTPLDPAEIRGLAVGDIVYITGRIFTARDQAHMLMLRNGIPPGLETRNMPVYHCGPIAKPDGNGGWNIISAGPTTSMRMESLEPQFLKISGAGAIIGKGGMGPDTLAALEEHGAVYLSITGGLGALAMKQLGPAKSVHFLEELGPVEAVWEFDAVELGPLVVTMDSRGNSLHSQMDEKTAEALNKLL